MSGDAGLSLLGDEGFVSGGARCGPVVVQPPAQVEKGVGVGYRRVFHEQVPDPRIVAVVHGPNDPLDEPTDVGSTWSG
ncbi:MULTISPECIES: hypothetical protein [unclassified Streptomyces]|uniref:hypothetical protein n=1 Tax=unclassified Streptomyces TaxID=2593676 RepID=UPI003662E2CA